jgi:hypothetical protein
MDMTDTTESADVIGAAAAAPEAAMTASPAAGVKLADLWPAATLVLGLVLTVAWNAGLFWLLYSVV